MKIDLFGMFFGSNRRSNGKRPTRAAIPHEAPKEATVIQKAEDTAAEAQANRERRMAVEVPAILEKIEKEMKDSIANGYGCCTRILGGYYSGRDVADNALHESYHEALQRLLSLGYDAEIDQGQLGAVVFRVYFRPRERPAPTADAAAESIKRLESIENLLREHLATLKAKGGDE